VFHIPDFLSAAFRVSDRRVLVDWWTGFYFDAAFCHVTPLLDDKLVEETTDRHQGASSPDLNGSDSIPNEFTMLAP